MLFFVCVIILTRASLLALAKFIYYVIMCRVVMAISEENFGNVFAANDSFKLTISRYRK